MTYATHTTVHRSAQGLLTLILWSSVLTILGSLLWVFTR